MFVVLSGIEVVLLEIVVLRMLCKEESRESSFSNVGRRETGDCGMLQTNLFLLLLLQKEKKTKRLESGTPENCFQPKWRERNGLSANE